MSLLAKAVSGLLASVPGRFRFEEAADGSVEVISSCMLSARDAAFYLGLSLQEFKKLGLRRRNGGHRPYHTRDLESWQVRREKFMGKQK